MIYRDKIERMLNDTDYLPGRIFSHLVHILIVVSLIEFSFSTLPDISIQAIEILRLVETCIVAVFTVEYVLRIAFAENKRRFIFSFYGIIDLAAILPFYIYTGLDLSSIRIFRLFILLRVFKLLKYNKAITRLHKAIYIAKEELILFCFIVFIMIYLSAVGIYYCEHDAQPEQFKSVFHCLWWSVVTLTTVGYGDMYPITVGGKLFTFAILILGLSVVAIPTGLLASALTQVRDKELAQDDSEME